MCWNTKLLSLLMEPMFHSFCVKLKKTIKMVTVSSLHITQVKILLNVIVYGIGKFIYKVVLL